jgi:hypothetical protein
VDTPEVTPEPLAFRRPADYYSSPVEEVRPIFPRWVPFGCGTASIVLIILLVSLAAAMSSGAFGGMFEMVFASMQGEVEKMMTPDVKPSQKAAFAAEMKAMRESIRANRLKMDRLQPLMRTMRDVVSDERVTPPEVDRLTREMHALNAARK